MKKIFLLIIPILIHVFLVIFLMKPYVDFSYYECNYISSEDKLKFIEHPKKLKVYVEEVKNISFINEWKDIEYINFTDTYFDDEQKEFLKKFSEENNCTIMIK